MTTLTDAASTDTLWIDPRHNGPRTSGNGGWVAGALARRLAARSGASVTSVASVALRAPVPLGRPLPLRWQADGSLALHAGDATDAVVADAAPASLDLALPTPPSEDEAEAAGVAARWRHQQRGAGDPYAVCFVCGFDRPDGLGVIVGPVGDERAGLMATTWMPSPALAGADGRVSVEATWAALDCPAGMAWSHRLGRGQQIMTVRMTAAIDHPLQPGARYRVLAWPLVQDWRKLHAGTAIVDAAGRVCARSQQLWLLPRDGR